ncbi:MAG: ATP-binding protein [Elusimicrobiota bacterium]
MKSRQESSSSLSPIFDHLADGVCLSNRGRIFYLNPAAERFLGTSLDLARGSLLCDLLCGHLSAPDCASCAQHCALRDPSGAERAVTFRGHYDRPAFEWREPVIERVQSSRDLRVRCLKTRPSGGPHLTIIEDDSARKSLEKERENWRSMIVHDLRGPLSSIFGALGTLERGIARGAPQKLDAEMIEIGMRNCLRMTELLDLYLDVSRFEAGQMRVEIKEIDCSEIARRCAEEQSPFARQRRIALVVDVPAGLRVLGDEELLPRVVQNLLNNAIKFTPESGRVEISAEEDSKEVRLSVSDTGPGIAAEDVPRLFDRYHQAKEWRGSKIKGSGLGLAFCRMALTAMRGGIQLESKPGEGSRFIIHLPAPLKTSGAPVSGRARASAMSHRRRRPSPSWTDRDRGARRGGYRRASAR